MNSERHFYLTLCGILYNINVCFLQEHAIIYIPYVDLTDSLAYDLVGGNKMRMRIMKDWKH